MRAIGNGAGPAVTSPRAVAALLTLATFALASSAAADEPRVDNEPPLMSETSEITSVVDAFDHDDPFDLHLTLGFSQMWKHANIRRETSLFQPGLTTGGFVARTENIASYNQSVSTLHVGADIGIYKDFALILKLPVILSDARDLGDLNGSSAVNGQRLQDPTGALLFPVPFKSPTRSGIDWFSVGLDYAIFNQQRDATKPTWVVGVEGRFAVGPSMHACNAGNDTTKGFAQCPNLDGKPGERDAGISRGMHGVAAHTVFARRFGYVEPYMGFWFLAEFPRGAAGDDFAATNDLKGALVNHPPLVGTFGMGLEVIPYEHREQFRRFTADFRVKGTYHSPGREYSELFDALGASQAPTLRNSNPGGFTGSPSVADPAAQRVFFTGITDSQAYSSIGGHTAITWQAGEHIKFTAGLGLTFSQSHLITTADACNPDFKSDASASGPCHGVIPNATGGSQPITGIPNPNHRPSIDLPGRRFSVDDTTIVDLWIQGVVMF